MTRALIFFACLENLALIAAATFLAYTWESGWPLVILLLCNQISVKQKTGQQNDADQPQKTA